MSKLLTEIEGCQVFVNYDNSVSWTAKMAVDVDGSPNWRRDPDGQADTSLHYRGQPINADAVPYVVVPPAIRDAVPGIVLGCRALVSYNHGKPVEAVVADIGPRRKLGEGSSELARRLGINPSPTKGGVDEHVVEYQIWPGVPAEVDGITYDLQPA